MGGYLNNTGKIFFGSLAAWAGAKLFQKYQESSASEEKVGDAIKSLEDMDLPESFKTSMREAAFIGDKRAFLDVLNTWQIPQDNHIRRRLWELAGGE